MHELSLCRQVLEIIEQQSVVQHYKRVKKICLEIGALANIEKSAFAFGFEVITQNTIAAGAVLEFIDVPGYAVCRNCGRIMLIHQWFDVCSACGSDQLTVKSGEEFRIKELEVE